MKRRYYVLLIVFLLTILSIGYISFGKKEANHELTKLEI